MLSNNNSFSISPQEQTWINNIQLLEDVLFSCEIHNDAVALCSENIDASWILSNEIPGNGFGQEAFVRRNDFA